MLCSRVRCACVAVLLLRMGPVLLSPRDSSSAAAGCWGCAVAMLSAARVSFQCRWLLLDSRGLAASGVFLGATCVPHACVFSQHNPVLCVKRCCNSCAHSLWCRMKQAPAGAACLKIRCFGYCAVTNSSVSACDPTGVYGWQDCSEAEADLQRCCSSGAALPLWHSRAGNHHSQQGVCVRVCACLRLGCGLVPAPARPAFTPLVLFQSGSSTCGTSTSLEGSRASGCSSAALGVCFVCRVCVSRCQKSCIQLLCGTAWCEAPCSITPWCVCFAWPWSGARLCSGHAALAAYRF